MAGMVLISNKATKLIHTGINYPSANCKCKLDTCTVELSESERRSGWKPQASVLGDAAAAVGCVNRVEELVKQFLRGTVAAAFIVRRVVFAKAACAYGNTAVLRSRFCKYRSGAKGKQHCGAEQQAYNFSLWFHCLILFETVGSNCLQTQKGASRPRKTAGETRLVFLI